MSEKEAELCAWKREEWMLCVYHCYDTVHFSGMPQVIHELGTSLSWVEWRLIFFCEGPNRFTTISWCFACCESMLRPEAPTEKPPKLQTSFWAWCGCGRPSLCLVHMIIWFICNFVYTSHGPRTYTDSDSLAQGSSGKFMSQSVSTMTVQWYEPTHLPWLRKITVYVLITFCLNQ